MNSVPIRIVRNPHTKFQFDRSSQSGLCLITRILSQNHNFLNFAQKWPPIGTKINRVHLCIIGDPHTKSQFDPSSQSGLCLITRILSPNHNFPNFAQKWPPIGTKINRVHLCIIGNPHTKSQLDRSSQSGLCLITRILSQNHNFPNLAQKWPPIGTKINRVHLCIIGNPHTKSQFDRSSQSGLCLITRILSQNHNFPNFAQKWPPIGTKINRVHLCIIGNPHTKSQFDRSSQSGLCLITRILSQNHNFPNFAQKWPPIGTKINRVHLCIIGNPHTKSQFDRSSQSGLCLITRILSQNHNFPNFAQKWPPIGTKINRVHLCIIGNPHTKSQFDRSSQSGLCLITRILSQNHNFPNFAQKWPPIGTKINRVHLCIIGNPHTKSQFDRSSQSGLCLITRILSQNHNFPNDPPFCPKMFIYVSLGTHTPNLSLIPHLEQKSIGFIYVSLGTHTPNLSLIGPVSLDFAWLQGFYPKITISPILPKNDPPSGQKSIGFIYVSLGTHTPNLSKNWSVQSVWTLPDYKDFIPKSQFPQFCPKMTPHRDKNQ